MMANKIIFRRPELHVMLREPHGLVGRHLAKRGAMIVAAAKRQVGVKTGALRASIHMRYVRRGPGQAIQVGSPLKYALAHHEGTRPHLIVPNRARVLRFSAGGRVVYTHAVRHPGTRANKYLTDNLYLIR